MDRMKDLIELILRCSSDELQDTSIQVLGKNEEDKLDFICSSNNC